MKNSNVSLLRPTQPNSKSTQRADDALVPIYTTEEVSGVSSSEDKYDASLVKKRARTSVRLHRTSIEERLASGSELALEFGVSYNLVWRIIRKEYWKHV